MLRDVDSIDLKGIIRRRKWIFLVSLFTIFSISTMISQKMPAIYRAVATIIIENQEIPDEYVKSTITTYVEERLRLIQRKVMGRTKLIEIIKKYDLYPGLGSENSKVNKMRRDIKLKTIDAAIANEHTGRRNRATIAFTLSYEGKNPEMVQKITNVLAQLYVEEDIQTRKKLAATTTSFFEKELEEQEIRYVENEKKIRKFKEKNINTLPGSMNVMLQLVGRFEQEIDRLNTRIVTLKEKKIYLETQILSVDPLQPVISEGGKVLINPSERLKALRMKLVRKQAFMSPKHPDIKAIKSEIAQLESQNSFNNTTLEKERKLDLLKFKMADYQSKYGEKHPDLIRIKKEVEILSNEIEDLEQKHAHEKVDSDKPNNPAYMNLRAQIIANQTELDSLSEDRRKIQDKLYDYQQRIAKLPLIEEEFSILKLDYENAKHKYNEILNKLLKAKIAEEMDVSQRGERFSITEPANLPESPYKPNRNKIILLGFILGAGIGIVLAALLEGMDSSVKRTTDVETILDLPVLASISIVNSPRQIRIRRLKTMVLFSMLLLIILFGIRWKGGLTLLQ